MSSRRRVGVIAGALAVVLGVGMLTPSTPAVAATSEAEDCTQDVRSEAQGLALARACDRAITVDSLLSEFSEVVAEPDGRMRLTSHVEPVRARDESGAWAPIDTTLRAQADGTLAPVNTLVPVSISNGGDRPFAVAARDGKRFGLRWPGRLPRPVLSGDTATYAEVLPGVDLRVRAMATGFAHDVVVKSRAAAQNSALSRLRLGTVTEGVSAEENGAGGIEVSDAGGVFMQAPTPMMWDSSPGPTGGSPENLAPVDVEVAASTLTLVPDAEVLTGADTDYPVVIDPLWIGEKRNGEWATVSEKWSGRSYWKTSHLENTATFGDAGVGRTCDRWTDFTCHTTSYRMRSFFRMNTEPVSRNPNRVITSAKFKLRQEHAWVCHDRDVSLLSKARIWHIGAFSSSTTWDKQPNWTSEYASNSGYANYGAGCPGGSATLEFDAEDMVKSAQDNAHYSVNLGMKAIDEGWVGDWKRFDSATATLNIYYNTRPGVPVGRSADGKGCGTSTKPVWVLRKSPYFLAQVTDADSTVRAQYEIRNASGDLVDSFTSGYVKSWTTYQWKTSKSLYESTYHWRARGYDGVLHSAWSTYCYFTVDSKPPKDVKVETLTSQDEIDRTRSVTLKFSAADANGITKFEYGFDERFDKTVAASGNTATVTLSALDLGRSLLFVRAADPAGHRSGPAVKDVLVGDDFPPLLHGGWRLNGDGLDDSSFHRDVTLGAGATWGPDRNGDTDSAVVLTGAAGGCAQTGGAAIRTDKAYSVAAWVRLASAGGANPTVLSQAGTNQPAFQLQLASNRWRLIMPSADTTSPTWQSVTAPADAAQGWTHVAATVDPVAKLMRLYIDGDPVASQDMTGPVWNAAGPLLLGCAGRSDGSRYNEFAGALDYVGVWQGRLSEAGVRRSMTDLSAALVAGWPLAGDGTETVGTGNDLTPEGGFDWVDNQYGLTSGAMSLDGAEGSCASTTAPVLRTDDSFSVSVWAKLSAGSSGRHPTLLSQAGAVTSAFFVGWDTDVNKWAAVMSSKDSTAADVVWTTARSQQSVARDVWQHVAAVYDADEKELRLFVNGHLEQTVSVTPTGWNASGGFHVGCTVLFGGARANWVKGAISGVTAHRGALTDDQVRTLYGNPPVVAKGTWQLDGPGSGDPDPSLLQDSSGNGHNLTVLGDYGWTDDRHELPEGSLTLDLAEGSCASTAGTVVATDESFTVAAWVKVDGLPAEGTSTVVSQATSSGSRFRLTHRGGNSWAFEVADGPGPSPQWRAASAVVAPDPQWPGWVHVAGVYDRSAIGKQVQLYGNGSRQATTAGPTTPWHEGGPMLIGCSRQAGGSNGTFLGSAVDEVHVWSSTVDPKRLEELATF